MLKSPYPTNVQRQILDCEFLSEPNRFLEVVSTKASQSMSLAWLCQKARGQNLHPCVSIMQTGKPDWWEDSLDFLKQDEILSEIVEKYPDGNLESRGRLFETTIRSIVGQQISVIAADAIWARLSTRLVILLLKMCLH